MSRLISRKNSKRCRLAEGPTFLLHSPHTIVVSCIDSMGFYDWLQIISGSTSSQMSVIESLMDCLILPFLPSSLFDVLDCAKSSACFSSSYMIEFVILSCASSVPLSFFKSRYVWVWYVIFPFMPSLKLLGTNVIKWSCKNMLSSCASACWLNRMNSLSSPIS